MKRFISLLLAAMLLISLCACGGGSDRDRDDDKDSDKGSISNSKSGFFISFDFEYRNDCFEEQGTRYFEYEMNIATVSKCSDKDVKKSINSVLNEFYTDAYQYNDNCRESAYSDYKDGNPNMPFFYSLETRVKRCDSGIVSLLMGDYTYFGGAHGTSGAASFNFDSSTGKQLGFSDLGEDADELRSFVLSYIATLITEDPYLANEISPDSINELIDNDQWYFVDDELVVYAVPYQIASFAAGSPEFAVPCSELEGLIYDKYMPEEHANKQSSISLSEGDGKGHNVVGSIVLDEEGVSAEVVAEGTIYDVYVYSATLVESGGNIVLDRCLWYGSSLEKGDCITAKMYIPDVYCNVVVVYTNPDGSASGYGIAQSGKDGSLYLERNY